MLLKEVDLVYRRAQPKKHEPKIISSKDAYELSMSIWSEKIDTIEEFRCFYLNRANRVKGVSLISSGGINATVVDARIIFAIAVKVLACGIIMVHNHPSGEKRPSDSDRDLTKKIAEAGKILDITLLDHLIITNNNEYYSFADEGYL